MMPEANVEIYTPYEARAMGYEYEQDPDFYVGRVELDDGFTCVIEFSPEAMDAMGMDGVTEHLIRIAKDERAVYNNGTRDTHPS